MKAYILSISLFFVSLMLFNSSYAQKQDSLKQKQVNYYSKLLVANQDIANQVATIMVVYKEGIKEVVADAALSAESKRVKIDRLIDEKNKKLERILTPAQQVKIIPTTERKRQSTR